MQPWLNDADAVRLVRTVHQIARPGEVERPVAERIIRSRRDDGRHRIVVLGVLIAYGGTRAPRGILHLAGYFGHAFRRRPTDTADADRIGVDDLRLTGLVRLEIPEAHRGEIDHDALAWRIRQHEAGRHDDLAARARQPRVDTGIGAHHLLVAHIEAGAMSEKVSSAPTTVFCTTSTASRAPGRS